MLRGKQVAIKDQSKEEIEDTSLTLLVNQASTSTITEEPITVNSNYFSPGSNNNNQNTDKLALKLNRLKEQKINWYPTFTWTYYDNYDQEFINNWYSNLKDFSVILMKNIVKFCGKTIEETAKSINEIQIKLRQNLHKNECDTIQNTIQINKKTTKKTLQQHKF